MVFHIRKAMYKGFLYLYASIPNNIISIKTIIIMKKLRFLILLTFAAILLAGVESCSKDEETTPKNPSWNVEPGKELPEQNNEPGNEVTPPQGAVSVAEAVQYVNSVSTASTDATDIVLKGICSESEIKELAQSISKGKASINLDLSNCEPEVINFQGCANLKEITLPDNVQMPERAFAECPDLEIVNIGDAKAQSKRLSKYSTDEFVDDVKDVVEDVADFIGECAEALWDWITSTDVKNDVSPRTYENCKRLRIVNVVSNNCKVIGEDAFKGCYNLETVNLGNVFVIDKRAFEGCTALASITIPASVSRMAESAFINCPKLKNVKFEDPNLWARTQSEAKWREYKYDQTYDITKHDFSNAGYYDASNPNVGDQYSWYFVHRKKVTNITAANVGRCYEGRYVFVFEKGYTISKFDELAAALKQRPDIKADVVINSHSQLDSYFSGWDGLYSVSSTVADRIGRSAFSGCANLASVAAKNVIKVGPYAFYGCPENIRITLGDHNNSGAWHITENQAEWDAKSGGDVYQGEPQWTKIIKYMYYNQGESDVPEYTVDYGEAAGFIRNLESNRTYRLVITGNYVRSMDIRNALDARGDDNVNVYLDFSKVKGMTEVWINFMSGVKNIYECRLPESVTIIEASAFLNCKNLRGFQMPSNLVKIGRCSFMGCGFTQSITLPSSLVDIEQGAFVNAFGGDAKPVLSSTDWYARNVTTRVETEYSKWKNTRWWDEQANYFYTSKSSRYGEPAVGDTDTKTITVNGVSFKMVLVSGGTFDMGSENGDSDESPVHQVTLGDYYIGQTEVTQALWQAVMGSNPSYYKNGDNYPVEEVSWNDCQEFISKLNYFTGYEFALPTEAQWEYAARGGRWSKGYVYSGGDEIGDVAWYWDNSSDGTKPVASKAPNELGIYDMTGNVWEWCQDWYDSGYYSQSPSNNPQGASSGSIRVLRGGSWDDYAKNCRVSGRYDYNPGSRFNFNGLRLVLLP